MARPEIRDPAQFPLQAAADAFFAHFEESTKRFCGGLLLHERTPTVQQYANLLKCVWLMERIETSNEFRNCSLDSYWPGYVGQLKENLRNECDKFAAPMEERLIPPDISNVPLHSPR